MLLGAYLVLGISNIRDGILFGKTNKAKVKTSFRISLPVIFAAFIPAKELEQFNQFLQKGSSAWTHRPLSIGEKEEEARD